MLEALIPKPEPLPVEVTALVSALRKPEPVEPVAPVTESEGGEHD